MKKIFSFLFIAFGVLALNAQDMTAKVPMDPAVKIGKLSNGLTYYVRNNPKPENKVELRLVIKAGSILEDEDQLGLAHFMEHMNFNGTKSFEKNELVDYLQSLGVKFGADLNAYTSFDETVYILPIPSEDEAVLDKGFQILSEWASATLLKGKDIDEERGVVLEELRLRQGANDRMLQKNLPVIAYKSKYAERLPIGTKENLETFEHKSLRRFFKDWYRPGLMAVIAVGDFDAASLEEKIKTYFGPIKPVKNPRERPEFFMENHEETLISIATDKEASFTQVQVSFKDKGTTEITETIEDYKASIIERLFTQMINNRLDDLTNNEDPPFIYGYSYHGGTLVKTKEAYQSVAATSATGQLRGLQTLLEENERVRRFGFKESELKRAKKSILSSLERAYKDRDKTESNRIVGVYVRHFLTGNPIPSIDWRFDIHKQILPSITLKDVNGVISKYLRDDNRTVILTGPEKEGVPVVTKQQVLDVLNNVKNKELKPYEEKEVAESMISDLPAKGSIVSTSENKALGTKSFVLSNGAKVTYKKTDFKNDEIVFDAFSFGGTSLYSDEELKATSFANGALSQAGVNNFSVNDMRKMMSGKIAYVFPSISSYSEGLSGSSTPKDLEELFQLVHLYFTSLNKDETAFKSYVNKQKSFLGNLLANPNFYFQKEMSDFMNEGNPRYTGFPSAEKYENADYDLAYKKYQERFANAGDFNFYFVGNIDEKKLMDYAMKYLGSLPATDERETYKVPTFRPKTGAFKKVVEKGKDQKSSVNIIFQGEAEYSAKESMELNALSEVLKIKLTEKMREEAGGVYTSSARGSLSKVPYGRFSFSINFPCGPENVDKLIGIAMAEVKSLIENGPTDKDLAKVKEGYMNDYKENIKTNRYWLRQLRGTDYFGYAADRSLTYESRVNALTKEDLQKVAKKYLDRDYMLGILNPEKQE
jgi:zinc protease